jgi:hypothetical protein
LIPGISKKVWSTAEEEKLLLLHKSYGNKWTIIAEYMPGRYLPSYLELITALKTTFTRLFAAVFAEWGNSLALKIVPL